MRTNNIIDDERRDIPLLLPRSSQSLISRSICLRTGRTMSLEAPQRGSAALESTMACNVCAVMSKPMTHLEDDE